VTLTRQDWRGAEGWGDQHLGYWEVQVAHSGPYAITFRFSPEVAAEQAVLKFGGLEQTTNLKKSAVSCTFESVHLPTGAGRVEAWLATPEGRVGVRYVDVRRMS
jgi:hypothetical protein